MPANLKAGSKADYVASMASAMEDAFVKEWSSFMEGADAPKMSDQMRLMFVAIAKGVVNHLQANPGAFKVAATQTSPGNYTGEVSSIQ
jgi:hypothetical protein